MSDFKIKAVVSKMDSTYAYLQGTREYSWVSPQGKVFSVLEKNKSEEAPILVDKIKIKLDGIDQKGQNTCFPTYFTACLSQSLSHGIPFMFGLNKESNDNHEYKIESISKNGDE